MFKKCGWMLFIIVLAGYFTINTPQTASAMHIMEGYLPIGWAIFWWALFIPFFIWGTVTIRNLITDNPEIKLLLGIAGAFTFVLSALKIPSVTGSSSHPTGVGLGTIMFGPSVMAVLGSFVLLFQAVLLAHGGLTTLGANAFSMAVVGPFVGYATYRFVKKISNKRSLAIFFAALLADISTYVVTSFQLALAFSGKGFAAALLKFMGIFAVTQIPLAVSEGLLTVLVWNLLMKYNEQEIRQLKSIGQE